MGATTMPDRPSAPPVIGVARLAISRHSEAIASVSMRSVRPVVRRMTAPVAMPSSAGRERRGRELQRADR